jgi:hypothetical protein
MQTFLPIGISNNNVEQLKMDYYGSLSALDRLRLGKQRLEAMQLVNSIYKLQDNPQAKVGWANHPARKMWTKYIPALKLYHNLSIKIWINRGYTNNMVLYDITDPIVIPSWHGDHRLHSSHRSNLLRKNFFYYSAFGWSEPSDLHYFWPSSEGP